jgi:hypothetical protein
MSEVIYILLGWAWTVGGCYALGRILWTRLGVRLSREEEIGFSFLLGAAGYSLLLFGLGLAHLYHRGVFFALPVGLGILGWWRGAFALPAERLEPLTRGWRRGVWLLGGPFALLYVSNAMAPELSPDGSTYHLGLVARYYREHAMVPVHTTIYSALSQGVEMLFLAAYAIGRHSAAAMVHATFLFLLPWMMLSWARRRGQAAAGAAAALLVFVAPVVGIDGISAYNDLAGAAVVFAVFALLDRWDEGREPGLLVAIGMLAGFSYGVKYTLALAVPLALGWVFWRERKWRPVLVVAGCAAVMILPWMARNAVWWHNPVAPLFNAWFPNPYVHQWFEKDYKLSMATYTLPSRWMIPWEVTVEGQTLGGRLGPVFLLAPLALLSLRNAIGRRLLLGWLVFSATYFSNVGTRFLIPGLPFLALAMTMVPWPRAALGAVVVVHAVLSWPDAMTLYGARYGWRLEKVVWREALRIKAPEDFLRSNLPSYPMVRLMDAEVPAGRRVFTFQQVAEAYCHAEVVVGFQSAQGEVLLEAVNNALREERKPGLRVRYEFAARPLTQVRAMVSKDWPEARWSVHEMRVFHGGQEIPRSPHWRARADSTSEWAPLAFDNSPVTRWIADVPWKKGHGLTVDLGVAQMVDEVVLEMSPDQPWEGIVLDGIPEARISARHFTPPTGLRRMAMEEFLARNVHYIVTAKDEHWYTDLRARGEYWGIEEIGTRGNHTLYRILLPGENPRIMNKE